MADFTRFAGQVHDGDLWFRASMVQPWGRQIELRAAIVGKRTFAAQPVVLVEKEESEAFPPFLTIDTRTAQCLMDQLWDCGLRPSEGTGSAGAMAAVQAHLKDMQRLVFRGKP